MGHAHSPVGLAARLEGLEGPEDLDPDCLACQEARETVDAWCFLVGHREPRVGLEYLTRYEAAALLFAEDESHAERLARVRRDAMLHSWGLCKLLVEESRRTAKAPTISQSLAELAHAVAVELDEEYYGGSEVEVLREEARHALRETPGGSRK